MGADKIMVVVQEVQKDIMVFPEEVSVFLLEVQEEDLYEIWVVLPEV